MNKRLSAHLALLGANLFYGAGFTVAKIVMPTLIQPAGFILIRVGLVTALFWLSYLGGKKFKANIEREDWKTLFLCAFFGVAANQLLFFWGLNLTSPIHASLMMLSTPILVSLFAVYALHDRLTANKIFGLLLGVSGAACLVFLGGTEKAATNALTGDLLVLLNATSYAIYLVMVKPLMTKYRPIIIIRWIFLIGLFYVIPFGIIPFSEIEWNLFGAKEYAAVLFIVLGCTFFAYLWNIYALHILSPATTGAYIYLQPVFAALIALFFYGEEMSLIKMLASILIFTGVYLVSMRKKSPAVVLEGEALEY